MTIRSCSPWRRSSVPSVHREKTSDRFCPSNKRSCPRPPAISIAQRSSRPIIWSVRFLEQWARGFSECLLFGAVDPCRLPDFALELCRLSLVTHGALRVPFAKRRSETTGAGNEPQSRFAKIARYRRQIGGAVRTGLL